MSKKRKAQNEGDRRAWQHAIESGAFGSILSDDEKEKLVLFQCYTAQTLDGAASVEEADLIALLEWAERAKLNATLVQNIVNGEVFVRMKAGDADPTFQLSPKGEAVAKESAQSMGLPIADDE
jgi:hypothetical protein